MNYNVDYEICTIIFLMLLLIISRVRKRLVDFQSKMYQIFMDVCWMSSPAIQIAIIKNFQYG